MSDEDMEPPRYVIKNWLRQCTCCRRCGNQVPCEGVMAGGLCDQACDCDIDDDFDYETDHI